MNRLILVALLASGGCGLDETITESVPITNGTPVTQTEAPWAAFLTIHTPGGLTLRCSGTLVEPDRVLTAAHCGVCADSIDVGLLGMAGPGQPPGTAPPTTIAVPKANIHVNPLAYPQAPPCNTSDPALLVAYLSALAVWGNDLAVLDLGQSVSLPTKPAMTTPPYGFSPVQDLYGQDVMIVGRGKPSPDSDDLTTMRKGYSSVDAWSRLLPEDCTEPHDLSEPFMLHLENDGGGESMIQSGDSGGPLIASVPTVGSRVIGVNSATQNEDEVGFMAVTFLRPNSSFLAAHGVGTAQLADADGDGVVDGRDNCPADANTDQIDLDGDGVGDVCDNCSPLDPNSDLPPQITAYDGTPSSAYSALYNPDQKNSNGEAESEQILASYPSYEDGGLVRSISESEYLDMFKGILGLPCNGATETQVKHMLQFRRGDACDDIPSPVAEVVYETASPDDFKLPPGGLCGANGYGFATCSYEVPVGFEVTPILGDGSGPAAGTAGARFCECALQHDDEAHRRLNCGAGTAADCAIDGTRYSTSDPSWLELATDEVSAIFGVEGVVATAFMPWDFFTDLAALSGTPLSFPLGINNDGTFSGVPPVDGITWFHAPTLGGQPISKVPGDGIRDPQQIASTYFDGDLRGRVTSTWHPFPQYKPPWPWEYCAVCNVLDFPWLWVFDDSLAVAVDDQLSAVDVSQTLDKVASALLQSGLRVPASEPEFRLAAAGVASREIVVASAEDVSPIGGISIAGDSITGVKIEGAAAGKRLTSATRVLAYSAIRDQLFDLSLADGARVARLSVWSGSDSRWRSLELSGAMVMTPLAMTFRLEDGSLYVIDRDSDAQVRLLSIHLDSGEVELLSRDLGGKEVTAASIANDDRAGLLVAIAGGGSTQLAHLALLEGRWLARDRAGAEATLVGEAREIRGAVYFTSERDQRLFPVKVELGAFEPGSKDIEPLF